MKTLKRFLCLIIAILTIMSVVACGSDNTTNNGESSSENGNENISGENSSVTNTEKNPIEISDEIKSAMVKNNSLTGAHFFLAEDGTILTLADDSDKGFADVYAKISDVKKLSLTNVGSAVFALTDSGDLYYTDKKIGTNVTDIAYCTTNSNVEGYCLIGDKIMWITSDDVLFETPKNSDFKNVLNDKSATGNLVSIEVDKHDFVVLNDIGDVFLYVGGSKDAYKELDFTGFENMVLVDIAKYMEDGDVKSLTVAGIRGDGTVVACGTYADEILSWGKLSYITMSDGMIVGLTLDGKIKMTGEYAEKMAGTVTSWNNIVAIEVGNASIQNLGSLVSAIDSDGNFFYVGLTNPKTSIETGKFSVSTVSGSRTCWKYTTDGKTYCSDDTGAWIDITNE